MNARERALARFIQPDTPAPWAVKAVGADEIRGYLVLWGDPDKTDIEGEYFTKSTDFWDRQLAGIPRPLTYDHAQDADTKAAPVIGRIVEMGDDDIGRWYTAQLDRAHRYRKAVDKLIASGALGTSSDSAPQYVIREKAKSGAVWLKQWPLFAGALTPTPAEYRMKDTVYFKSLGLEIPDPEAQLVTVRAMVQKAERLFYELKEF